ncbi:MAG TPA: VacB/RNase II family 3'-5' exoribonuclease [Acidobacteriota bacterium]
MNTTSILAFLRKQDRPVTIKELVRHFDLHADQRRGLKRWLEAQAAEGNLQRVKKNLYTTPRAADRGLVSGRLTTHRDGFGFVVHEQKDLPDIFVPPHALSDAVHGDQVRVAVSKKRGGRLEGTVVEVLSRSQEQVVGKVFRQGNRWMVSPIDERYHYTIHLTGATEDLREGQIVNVSIVAQPKRYQSPVGRITTILGFPDDPEIQFKIVCYKNGIPMEFSTEIQDLAAQIKPPGIEEIKTREDLRQEPIVTIDGETARDFDDAISIERRSDGFLLGVHIADVSHYVAPGSPIDTEAFLRGTSVYFPDRAIPMLPESLSNDVCSLKPDQDRLTLSVFMNVGEEGKVTDYRFSRSVIRSRARMTYTAVRKILIDQDPLLRTKHGDLVQRFEWMLELSGILTAKRKAKGAIDFDLPEAEIEYDVNGEVFDIVRSERNEAHRLIEEFMLLANETVAKYLARRSEGTIYRVHEDPDPVKVHEFARLVREFGYSLGDGQVEAALLRQKGRWTAGRKRQNRSEFARREALLTRYSSKDFQRLSEKLSGKPEERFLSYLMLRSFKQARYSATNLGHFGLATRFYTHFTSPIRRYPDLVVHRLLKKALLGEAAREKWQNELEEIAERSSDRERKADEAEREIMKWLMAIFMSERVGEEYEGFVSGVRQNGFFVELLDHFVEGFVHVSKLADDYYFFDERAHRLVGENSGKMFALGERMRIVVDKVDKDRHLIDFAPAGEAPARPRVRGAIRSRRRSGSKRRR